VQIGPITHAVRSEDDLISRTSILILRAELRAFMFRVFGQLAYFIEILKNVENSWGALAVRFGILECANLRLRGKSVSAFVTKDDFSSYVQLARVSSSRKIAYVGGGKFRFLHSRGLEFDYRDSGPAFFASCASDMDCYCDDSNNVVCVVVGLKFIMPFPHGAFELKEIFIDREYGEPNCDNAVVVDVGAFIGDSSLFFASRGAKVVVAFEPVPELFKIFNKNIALNGFKKIIDARNEAVSDSFGTVNIGYLPSAPGSSGQNSVEVAMPISVNSTSLNEVIMSLGWVDILKMDCEGCEHRALRHAAENGSLRYVGTIIMEVHSEVRSLIELLKNEGFRIVKLTKLPLESRWILNAQRRNRQPKGRPARLSTRPSSTREDSTPLPVQKLQGDSQFVKKIHESHNKARAHIPFFAG